MSSAVLEKDMEHENSADVNTGIGLQMHLLPSQKSEERPRDHCDYLLDAIDQQLDQLQARPRSKNSQMKTEEHTKCVALETYSADVEQSLEQIHETDSQEPKDVITTVDEQTKECKKEEYKWRLTRLLGSEQMDFHEYCGDANSAESVCTEDFIVKFSQGMVEPLPSNGGNEGDGLNGAQYSSENQPKFVDNDFEKVGASEDNFSLNTARREDILQQFKVELEDDLQAAISISDEGKFSGVSRKRRESVESLGGRISRLSQANILEPSSIPSLERSLGGSYLSSGTEGQQRSLGSQEDPTCSKIVKYPFNSTVREGLTRAVALETKSGFQTVCAHSVNLNERLERNTVDHKLEFCYSKGQSHFVDDMPNDTKTSVLEDQKDKQTCGYFPEPKNNLSVDCQNNPSQTPDERNAEKSRRSTSSVIHLGYGDIKNGFPGKTLCSDKTGQVEKNGIKTMMERKEDYTQSPQKANHTFGLKIKDCPEDLISIDWSLKEGNGVAQYKHLAGIPLRCFDSVTVDSDLDSVRTERVRNHIRKARTSRRGDTDSEHNLRRMHRNHADSTRYTACSKTTKDDDDDDDEDNDDFETTFPNTEQRSDSNKLWTSSPNKASLSFARSLSSDFQSSPDQSRRLLEDLATERVVLEESIAKLRRDAIMEEERLTHKKAQCREADLSLNCMIHQKKEAYLELESLRDLLEKTQKEMVRMESRLRETQNTEESFRSEVVLLEYKRNEYLKELKDLDLELDSIKQRCSSAHSSQIADLKYEISTLTCERDELKVHLRHLEGSLTFMERQELERQLSNAKSELYSEQRTNRVKIEKLQENFEESQSKLEEKTFDCAAKQEKHKELKSQLRDLEKKYETQIQKWEEEASDQKEAFTQQVTDLSSQMKEQSSKIASLEKILSEKELDLLRLRDVICSLKAEKEAHALAAATLKEEQNKRVLEMQLQHQQDKERQLAELKAQLQSQKQQEIHQFAENMEQLKIKALQDQAESIRKGTDKALKTLEAKDKEITKLKEALKSQKETMKKLAADLKQEAREMVHNTLHREQKKWEGEKKDALQIQRHTLEEEKLREMVDMREALEREHRTVMALEKKIADLQNIIQEHEMQERSLLRDKQEALDELHAVLKEEKQEDMMKLQQELAQERERDLERLKIRLQQMEEDHHVLRAEKNESVFREREALAQAERAERALAREMTAVCERILNGPGRPRKESPSRNRHGSPSRLSTNQALQMLHGVSEETNQYIHDLQQEIEAQKRTVIHVQREKERELQQMKEQLQMDKEKALSLLKDRLIQEHIEEITNLQRDQMRETSGPDGQSIRQQLRDKDNELRAIQRNMSKWKEETATKLAEKFEEELNAELEKSLSRSKATESYRYLERVGSTVGRLQEERRENSHLRSASTPALNGVAAQHDFGALKILRNLQGRVRELRPERRVYRGASMEDLSMLRSDLGNSYREKRPFMAEQCMTPLHGRSIRK